MKKAFLAFAMVLMASPAYAGGLVTKHASSTQLTVDAARTTATRMGNSYSVSGSGVTLDVGGGSQASADLNVGGLGTITTGSAGGSLPTAYQTTDGSAFSYSNSFTAGDTTITTAPSVGDISAFSSQTSYAAGSAGSLAGTITSGHAITLTAGGAGSSATGQFVSEITVID
jgi:hypothetical protein